MTYPDASGVSNFTALQTILKEYYGPQQVKQSMYKRNKFFAMVHKEEDWSGLVVPIPVHYGAPQGASATFSNALAQVTASKVDRFVMNWCQDYAVATITNLVSLASRNDAGAFLKAVKTEMDGAMRTAENRWAGGLFRRSTGSIGAGTVHASNGTVTLSDPMAITQVEVNQKLEAATSDGGAAIGSPNYGYVISVNRAAGTFVVASDTYGGTGATPTSWNGQTDYFRVAGDRNLRINGLPDWLPSTTPASNDSFNNVNRSADPTRLAGVRWNGSSQTIEEALIDAAALSAREEGNPELVITNHTSWAGLVKALGSKVNYVNYEHDEVPGVGFQGVRIHGADGEINVFADRSCQGLLAYGIDPDSWVLGSMKALPHILTELDGLESLRDPNNDATQVRIGGYGILACDKPGANFVATLQV